MKLILKKDVDNLGEAGEVVDVADGYGNNYLLPRGLAMKATRGAIKDAEAIARKRQKHAAATIADAEGRRGEIERASVVVTAKAGEDGQLYGSVGATALREAAREQLGVTIGSKELQLGRPIKSVGAHEVPVRLHRDVEATLKVEVAPTDEDEVVSAG